METQEKMLKNYEICKKTRIQSHVFDKQADYFYNRKVNGKRRRRLLYKMKKWSLNMNWLGKLERRFGRYAIPNLMFYIMILYGVGFIILNVNPMFYIRYLSPDMSQVFRGQIWRLVTFIVYPPSSDILYFIIAMFLYYSLGVTLERVWGSFRFNLYFFSGVIGNILAALIIYLAFGMIYLPTTSFLNLSLFFAFAATFPDMQFLLFFIIPVKAKWLGILNGIYFVYELIVGSWATRIAIVLSVVNFLVFFLGSRNLNRVNPKEVKRKVVYRQQVKTAKSDGKHPRHRCAVCGRTELDDETLEFRFCSKCDGNYEYCQDHLYTHKHVTAPGHEKS